jgi:hypothetical protein
MGVLGGFFKEHPIGISPPDFSCKHSNPRRAQSQPYHLVKKSRIWGFFHPIFMKTKTVFPLLL